MTNKTNYTNRIINFLLSSSLLLILSHFIDNFERSISISGHFVSSLCYLLDPLWANIAHLPAILKAKHRNMDEIAARITITEHSVEKWEYSAKHRWCSSIFPLFAHIMLYPISVRKGIFFAFSFVCFTNFSLFSLIFLSSFSFLSLFFSMCRFFSSYCHFFLFTLLVFFSFFALSL